MNCKTASSNDGCTRPFTTDEPLLGKTGHGHEGSDQPVLDWASLSRPNQTTVFYMGGRMAGQIETRLRSSGMQPDTPVVVVSSVSRPQEHRWAGPLGKLADAMQTIGTDEPVLIGIGAVFGKIAKANACSEAMDTIPMRGHGSDEYALMRGLSGGMVAR